MTDLIEYNDLYCHGFWQAICKASELLASRCSVFMVDESGAKEKVNLSLSIPNKEPWQLMEALCLLVVLLKADSVHSHEIKILSGKSGPYRITENEIDRFIWTQATLSGEESTFNGRPDIIATINDDHPTAKTAAYIVECKSGKNLGAQQVRAEFGKAFDLKVSTYLIWSFHTPPERVVQGAEGLGMDIMSIGLDVEEWSTFIENPEHLVLHVKNTIDYVLKKRKMAAMIEGTAEQIVRKKLTP